MLIKGKNADNMKFGDTLSNDQFNPSLPNYINVGCTDDVEKG